MYYTLSRCNSTKIKNKNDLFNFTKYLQQNTNQIIMV